MSLPICLEMTGITKTFPGVKALDNVDFSCKLGEIHALVGENGAGKSTLMNMLGGLIRPDEGEIKIDGRIVDIFNPIDSYDLGIGFVHQESNFLGNLTVLENVFLAHEETKYKTRLDKKAMKTKLDEIQSRYGYTLPADVLINNLKLADKQLVEIARALLVEPKILIMDEPTAALCEEEVLKLFEIIRTLKNNGVCIIYISHRMEEIVDIADQVTVFKDGRNVGTLVGKDIEKDRMISMMVGRSLDNIYPDRSKITLEKEILKVEGITIPGYVKDVSFSVKEGEIYGFGGLDGQGQREVARAIFGEIPITKGTIEANGVTYIEGDKGIKRRINNHIGYVTHDRHGEGLIHHQSIIKNASLPILSKLRTFFMTISERKEKELVSISTTKLDLKAFSLDQAAGTLSGGNQQKVMLARWLMVEPKILIIDEPTKGVDVGARVALYNIINDLTKQGVAVIILTSDMLELIGLSDRILVFYEGTVVSEIDRASATEEALMQASCGINENNIVGGSLKDESN